MQILWGNIFFDLCNTFLGVGKSFNKSVIFSNNESDIISRDGIGSLNLTNCYFLVNHFQKKHYLYFGIH